MGFDEAIRTRGNEDAVSDEGVENDSLERDRCDGRDDYQYDLPKNLFSAGRIRIVVGEPISS